MAPFPPRGYPVLQEPKARVLKRHNLFENRKARTRCPISQGKISKYFIPTFFVGVQMEKIVCEVVNL
jgi:hypothetical protein